MAQQSVNYYTINLDRYSCYLTLGHSRAQIDTKGFVANDNYQPEVV